MPIYRIKAPNGQTYRIEGPPGASDAEVADAVMAQYPEAGKAPTLPKESTIGSELIRGGKQLVSSTRTGIESLLDANKAATEGAARSEAIGKEAGVGPSLDAVKKAYEEKGLLSAAGETASQIPKLLAGQVANVGADYAGAKLGSTLGSAFGTKGKIVGGALGTAAAMFPQFVGSNVERQASEQEEAGKPVDVNLKEAVASAAGQSALESLGVAALFGKRVVKGVLGIADDAALRTTQAQAELVKAAQRSLAASAGRGVVRGATEIPVEVGQQILERYQAGLDLTSDEALKEYGESAYQAGLIGGTVGGGTGALNRGAARSELEQQQRAEAAAQTPPTPEPEPEVVPGAKLPEEAPVKTQGTLFTPREMGKKVVEPREAPAPQPETYAELTAERDRLRGLEQTPEVRTQLDDIAKKLAPTDEEQQTLGLDFQRDYIDLFKERDRLREGEQTPEAKARIAELSDQLKSYDEADIGQRQADKIIKEEKRAAEAEQKAKDEAAAQRFPGLAGPTTAVITQADIDAIGLPLRTSKQWITDNVLGKTVEEVKALIAQNPSLVGNKGARAEVLKALVAPQPKAFEEKPNEPTPTETNQSQGELDLGGGEPSVGVSDKPASTDVVQPGAGVSTTTGASTTPDGLGLAPAGQPAGKRTKTERAQPPAVTDRQQRIAFGKALGAAQSYPGMLSGRKNVSAQTAAKNGDFAGVVTALESSKNATVAEVARRAKTLGTKIQIDDTAGETYEGRSAFEDQMSIDGAKMHLAALNKLRELAPTVAELPKGATLPYSVSGASVPAFQEGKEYPSRLALRDIVKNNNSMFAPLGLPEKAELRTKEDFNALLDAFERTTKELGEDKLRLTSTASAIQQGVAGQYDVGTDTIRVPEYYAKKEEVLAHEIVHAQVTQAVANPTLAQRPAVQRLNKLYAHVKSVVEKQAAADKNFRSPYGVASQQEFIAEGLSNPDFQYMLSRIPYEASTAWDKFTEIIAKLVGIKNDNAFTELLTIYGDLTNRADTTANAPTTTATTPSAPATPKVAKEPKKAAKPIAKATPPKTTEALAPAVTAETVDEEAARKAEAEDFKRRLEAVERRQKEDRAKADAAKNLPTPKAPPVKKAAPKAEAAPEIEPEVVSPFDAIAKYKAIKAKTEAEVKNKPKAEVSYAEKTALTEATLQERVANGDVRGALQAILSAPEGLYNDLDRAVARRILLSSKLPTVQIVEEGALGKADDGSIVAGQYNAVTDQISLVDGYVGAYTLLHELIHGFTHRAIESHLAKDTNNTGVRALQELYDHVAKVNPAALKTYGMTNLSEFAAEAMSNKKFQAVLQEIPYRRTNAFTEFARSVLRVLGLAPTDTHTALAAAMISVDNLMTSGRQMQIAGTGTSVAGAQNTPKVQFSSTYTAQDVVNSLGPLTPLNKQGVLGLIKGVEKEGDPSAGVKFRVAAADSAAAIEEKFSRTFNGAVRDKYGKLNPMGLYRQAQDYSKLLLEYFQNGTLVKDKTTGLYRTVGKGEGAPADVFDIIYEWGKKTGRSKEEAEQFASRILEAKRLDELLRVNPDFPKHMSDKDRAILVAAYNSDPAYAKMSEAMDRPRIALIDKMVEVGRLSKETAAEWKAVVGYVPFDRIEDFSEKFSTVKKTTGRSPLALTKDPELVGSLKRPVGNVFENYINTMGWMVGQVMNNDARIQTLRGLEDLGFTKAASRVPGTEGKTAKAYVNGELMYWELPSRYDVAAFQDLNPPKMAIMRTLGAFSNTLRKTVTILPPFALKQVTDDVQRAMLTSGVKSPTALLRMTLANFGSLAWAELRGIQHPIVKEFGALGLTGEYDFEAGKPAVSLLKDLGHRDRTVLGSTLLGNLLHRLDGITRASDLAVRKAIFDQTLKENNNDMLLAQSRAREFINFRRRGASEAIAIATATIPFFNAYVQGMDVLYRAASGKDSSSSVGRAQARQLFWSRAWTVAGLSTMYALVSGDDDDYKDMDLRTRNSNWILPGGYKLPVPGELGALFKVIPETVVEYLKRSGTPEEQTALEAIRSAAMYMFEQYVGRVVPIPQAVKPLIEAWTNYSFFTGRELEGIYQKQQDPSMRVTSKTSELAQAISNFSRDVIGVDAVSPIQIDNMLNGYFGSSAALFTMMTDSLINPSRVDRPLHKYALLSNYMYDPVGTRRLTEFYDEREKVGKANNTLRQLMTTDMARAEAYANAHQYELAMESAVNSTLEQLERTRAYRKHLNSPDGAAEMSKADREKSLEEIKKMEVEYTRWVREAKAALNKAQ